MNIHFLIISSLLYTMTEKWTSVDAPPPPPRNVRTFSLEERNAAVDEFKRYYPVLNQYWAQMGEDKSVMKSALGCAKLALVCPFLNTWRLVLLGIGYGLNADRMSSFMMTDGSSGGAPSDEFYQQISEFNELAQAIGESSDEPDMSRVFESTDSTLKSIFKTFITGTNQLSKLAVNEMGNSLKSCLEMFGLATFNRKSVQDFVDAIKNRTSAPADWEDSPTEATDMTNSGGFLGDLGDFLWKHHDPPIEFQAKMKKIDSVRRAAGGFDSRGSEKSAWSSIMEFFRGKEEDPFKNCIKTDLRERADEQEDDDEEDHDY